MRGKGRGDGRGARAWLLCGLACAGLLGCRHLGGAWELEPARADGAVELIVVGQPRDGRASRLVAAELEAQRRSATRAPALIWLAPDLGPRGPERSGPCPSAAAAIELLVEGSTTWGLPGPDRLRCEVDPDPPAFVLRVHSSGAIELVSRCDEGACTIEPASEPPLVELVFLELSFWLFPELLDADAITQRIAEQTSLLDAIAAAPAVPRILISPIPIESAGSRGLGGRRQRTSYRYLPEFVQAAIAEGMFIGTIGALERDLQVSADLSDAIVRGDRTFVERPLFGINTGSAGGAGHTLPTSRGHALRPDIWTEHTGFVGLRIGASEIEIDVHARVGGRWQTATITVPLDPPTLDPLRSAPTIQPCPSCDPQSGAADGEVFVPRDERPR